MDRLRPGVRAQENIRMDGQLASLAEAGARRARFSIPDQFRTRQPLKIVLFSGYSLQYRTSLHKVQSAVDVVTMDIHSVLRNSQFLSDLSSEVSLLDQFQDF